MTTTVSEVLVAMRLQQNDKTRARISAAVKRAQAVRVAAGLSPGAVRVPKGSWSTRPRLGERRGKRGTFGIVCFHCDGLGFHKRSCPTYAARVVV